MQNFAFCGFLKKLHRATHKRPRRAVRPLSIHIVQEGFIKFILANRAAIADDDELHAGAGHRHIHAPIIRQKADVFFLIGAHEGDVNDIALLPLKTIDGRNSDIQIL